MSNEIVYYLPKGVDSLVEEAELAWTGIKDKLGTKDWLLPEIRGVNDPAVSDPDLVRYELTDAIYAVFEDVGEGIVARFGSTRTSFLQKVDEAMSGAGYRMPIIEAPSMENEVRGPNDLTGFAEQYRGLF